MKGKITSIVCVVAVVALCYWWFNGAKKNEPNLDELKSLVAQGPPSPEQAEGVRKELEEHTANMNDEEKGNFFWDSMMPALVSVHVNNLGHEYDRLMELPEAERNQELDHRIDELLKKSKEPAVKPGPKMTEGQKSAFGSKMLDVLTPTQRAKLDNGSKLIEQRMKQRGITPPKNVPGGLFQ